MSARNCRAGGPCLTDPEVLKKEGVTVTKRVIQTDKGAPPRGAAYVGELK